MDTNFTLRIDWICHDAYGEPVTVDLYRHGRIRTLRKFDNPYDAASWARKWLNDRGYEFTSDINERQRMGWRFVTLFPRTMRAHDR